ncbi:MAG: flagellar biosynthetic protein FliO [Bryobacteraceae bacterium]
MDLIRESLGITIVFALLWAALWLLKRKGAIHMGPPVKRGGRPHCVEVIDKIRLTPQHSVHVVQVGDRQIVLGVHAGGFTVIASTDNPGTNACATAAGNDR